MANVLIVTMILWSHIQIFYYIHIWFPITSFSAKIQYKLYSILYIDIDKKDEEIKQNILKIEEEIRLSQLETERIISKLIAEESEDTGIPQYQLRAEYDKFFESMGISNPMD